MNKNAVLILHGFFEHKGRHEINAKWFQKLNIDSHLIDLPGHGEFVEKRGSIDSWYREPLVNMINMISVIRIIKVITLITEIKTTRVIKVFKVLTVVKVLLK